MHDPRSRPKPPPAAPEITTGPAALGRETLVAIAEDEADQARAMLDRKRQAPPSSGTVPVSTQRDPARGSPPARDSRPPPSVPDPHTRPTAVPDPSSRPRFATLGYHEAAVPLPPGTPPPIIQPLPLPEPPAAQAEPALDIRLSSAPELITMGVKPMGRETLAAITGEMAEELLRTLSLEERSAWLLQLEEAEVLEPFRFEVRNAPMLIKPNDSIRREFVAARLLHRMPVRSVDEIIRIDAAPVDDDTLALTLWVRIPERR